jgi:hypothetical protein
MYNWYAFRARKNFQKVLEKDRKVLYNKNGYLYYIYTGKGERE